MELTHEAYLGHPKFERYFCFSWHELQNPTANERQDAAAQHAQTRDSNGILEFQINHNVPIKPV